MLTGNMAEDGGGAVDSVLSRCRISGNVADDDGGGVRYCDITASTLTGNSASSGGGASESRLTNCTIFGNSSLVRGGGVLDSVVSNCLLTNNHAANVGGGAVGGILLNCTLVGNSAASGGGASQSLLTNCIVYFNTAISNEFNHRLSTFHTSCTTPLPAGGFGNITNAPIFINQAGGGPLPGQNLRLASNSPCLNIGDNAFAALTDLDGRPRLIGGTVDMGAYEFQTNVSGLFIGYLQQFGLPTDGTADTTDTDGDRLNNFQEWRTGTIPTSASSALRLLTPLPSGTNLVVSWESVPSKTYFLTRSTNLTTGAGFVPLAQNLPGQFGSTSYTDTNAVTGQRLYFYQVGVE